MKLFLVGLLLVGFALIGWGSAITNGNGSADERVAGAFPILAGAGFIVLSVVIAFLWLVVKA